MRYYNLNIPENKWSSVTALHLKGMALKTVPPLVFKCINLEVLDLSDNQIESLPRELNTCHALKKLDLSENLLHKNEGEFTHLPTNLTALNLSKNDLIFFPEQVARLKKMQTLDISANKLTKVSASIQQLGMLQDFNLANNKLKNLLQAVGKLKALRKVDLSHNCFLKYPVALGNCLALNNIQFANNRLKTLPSAIGNAQNLSILNLKNNKLKHLPKSLAQCSTLRNLDLSHNQFNEIPSCILQMNWLNTLNFSHNQFKKLNFFHSPQQLEVLNLKNNKINSLKNIPNTIRTLLLDNNQLKSIPKTVFECPNLSALYLNQNRIDALPPNFETLGKHIKVFEIRYNPVRIPLSNILNFIQLEQLAGLQSKTKGLAWIQFLANCRKVGLPTYLFVRFYEIANGKKNGLDEIAITDLIKGLNLGIAKSSQIIRKYLYKESGIPYYKNQLKKGHHLAILGFTFFDKKDLGDRLSEFNISLSEAITPITTHVVLGWKTLPDTWENRGEVSFLSEKKLSYALSKMEKGYLLHAQNKEMLAPIRQLLFHKDEANIDLALELLKTGGCPPEIVNDIFNRWMSHNESKFISLLARHLEDDWKSEIFMHTTKKWQGNEKIMQKFMRKNKLSFLNR